MQTRECISPKDAAGLELKAAQHRLDLAHRALRRFIAEHCIFVDDRRCVAVKARTILIRAALDRMSGLLVEINETVTFKKYSGCARDSARVALIGANCLFNSCIDDL